MYKYMIGKFQYVVHSIQDIALSIGIVARFSTNPRENHLMAVENNEISERNRRVCSIL